MKIIAAKYLNEAGAVEVTVTGGATFIDDRARPAPAEVRELFATWLVKNKPEPYAAVVPEPDHEALRNSSEPYISAAEIEAQRNGA